MNFCLITNIIHFVYRYSYRGFTGDRVRWIYTYPCHQYLSSQKLWIFSYPMYSLQLYVIQFVSDLRHDCTFLQILGFPPQLKLHDRHDTCITKTVLKVAVNTFNL